MWEVCITTAVSKVTVIVPTTVHFLWQDFLYDQNTMVYGK